LDIKFIEIIPTHLAFGLRPFFLVVAAPLLSIKLNTFLCQFVRQSGSGTDGFLIIGCVARMGISFVLQGQRIFFLHIMLKRSYET